MRSFGFAARDFGLRPTPKIPVGGEKKPLVTTVYYSMKTPTRQHVASVESVLKKRPFWAWSSVPSPRDEAQRTCVWEAMVATDFMRSLRSRGLKVIWAQHRTDRAREVGRRTQPSSIHLQS